MSVFRVFVRCPDVGELGLLVASVLGADGWLVGSDAAGTAGERTLSIWRSGDWLVVDDPGPSDVWRVGKSLSSLGVALGVNVFVEGGMVARHERGKGLGCLFVGPEKPPVNTVAVFRDLLLDAELEPRLRRVVRDRSLDADIAVTAVMGMFGIPDSLGEATDDVVTLVVSDMSEPPPAQDAIRAGGVGFSGALSGVAGDAFSTKVNAFRFALVGDVPRRLRARLEGPAVESGLLAVDRMVWALSGRFDAAGFDAAVDGDGWATLDTSQVELSHGGDGWEIYFGAQGRFIKEGNGEVVGVLLDPDSGHGASSAVDARIVDPSIALARRPAVPSTLGRPGLLACAGERSWIANLFTNADADLAEPITSALERWIASVSESSGDDVFAVEGVKGVKKVARSSLSTRSWTRAAGLIANSESFLVGPGEPTHLGKVPRLADNRFELPRNLFERRQARSNKSRMTEIQIAFEVTHPGRDWRPVLVEIVDAFVAAGVVEQATITLANYPWAEGTRYLNATGADFVSVTEHVCIPGHDVYLGTELAERLNLSRPDASVTATTVGPLVRCSIQGDSSPHNIERWFEDVLPQPGTST
jgi:hypothetical protein